MQSCQLSHMSKDRGAVGGGEMLHPETEVKLWSLLMHSDRTFQCHRASAASYMLFPDASPPGLSLLHSETFLLSSADLSHVIYWPILQVFSLWLISATNVHQLRCSMWEIALSLCIAIHNSVFTQYFKRQILFSLPNTESCPH